MKTSLRQASLFVSVVLLIFGVAKVTAEPVAYEGFDYGSTPNLFGADGGNGWSTAWFDLNILPTGVTSESLDWPGLSISGGSAFTASFPSDDFTQYSRGLSAYEAPEGRVYLSFLIRPNPGFGTTGGLAFGTWTDGIVAGVRSTGVYGLAAPSGSAWSDSDLAVFQGETTLLVIRVEQDGEGGSVWSLYANPTIGSGEPDAPIATLLRPMLGLPQAVMIYNDGGFSTDEIRVGTQWADVLPAASCQSPADINQDCQVNVTDLLMLLGDWGSCDDPGNCPADFDGDGTVGVTDLLELLAAWG